MCLKACATGDGEILVAALDMVKLLTCVDLDRRMKSGVLMEMLVGKTRQTEGR